MNSTIRLVLSTAVALGLFLAPAPGSATTPTPGPTPDECVGGPLHFAQLHLELSIEPAHPRVGDDVVLTAKISTVVDGLVGIPQYTLSGTNPFFSGDVGPRSAQFGPDDQIYELHAVQAGTAQLVASVTYETAEGCVDNPIFSFLGARSEPLVVEIGAGAGTPSPTPTATPEPVTCVGDCNGDGAVTISEIVTGVDIGLSLAPITACPAFDRNGDESITVDELVAGVQSGLSSCPAANAQRSHYCRSLCDDCRNCHPFTWGSGGSLYCSGVCGSCRFECGGI